MSLQLSVGGISVIAWGGYWVEIQYSPHFSFGVTTHQVLNNTKEKI